MTLFLLVDTSGSMTSHGNIGKVNAAIEEMIPLLQEVSDENADAEIKIAVLDFSTGCRWVTHDATGKEGAEALETFFWSDLQAAGLTDMGAAFVELEKRLSRTEFLASSTGAYAPVFILLSDGKPTDNIQEGIEKLKHNNWYRNATKIALAVDDADTAALEAFTGNSETVIKVDSERQDLKNLLCRLAVVASSMRSRSVSVDTNSDAESDGNNGSDEPIDNGEKEIINNVIPDWNKGW